jgi:very-short-patch-repair endonuclease
MSTVDPHIVRIAERRLHLVTDDEIQRLGLSPRSIRRWIETRQLHRVAPNVLSTSAGPYELPQRELAICLSIPDAVLSHASATAYWGLRRAPKDRFEITVPKGARVSDRTAVVHYSNCMPAHHVVELASGARVTSVPRTLFDVGGLLPEAAHLSVIEDARNKGLCTDAEIGEVYDDLCGRGRRGSAAWIRLVSLVERTARPTMSEQEQELQEALIEAGLPPAIQQHPVTLPNGRVVHLDLAYPAVRLNIEVDHSQWHATPTAVAQDKQRDRGLALLGWERLRFVEHDLAHHMGACVAEIRAVHAVRSRTFQPPTDGA